MAMMRMGRRSARKTTIRSASKRPQRNGITKAARATRKVAVSSKKSTRKVAKTAKKVVRKISRKVAKKSVRKVARKLAKKSVHKAPRSRRAMLRGNRPSRLAHLTKASRDMEMQFVELPASGSADSSYEPDRYTTRGDLKPKEDGKGFLGFLGFR